MNIRRNTELTRALACAAVLLLVSPLRAQTPSSAAAPPGSGFWNMDVRAETDKTSTAVTYSVEASRNNGAWINGSTFGAWSTGIGWNYGHEATQYGESAYSNFYYSEVVTSGDIQDIVIRLRPFSGADKVAWPPRLDPHISARPTFGLQFLIKVPKGWHYVDGSMANEGPVDDHGGPIPFPYPPVYTKLAGDHLNPNMLTLNFAFKTLDDPNLDPASAIRPRYAASFQLAPDAAQSLRRHK